MSSERAGTHIHGRLDREQVREVINRFYAMPSARVLDALEACVVQDPRITRIEALVDEWEGHGLGPYFLAGLRDALRGDQ